MRIRWYDRVLLFLVAVVLLGAAALCLGLLSMPVGQNIAYRVMNLPGDPMGKTLLAGAGAVLAVLSVYLLCVTFIHKKKEAAPRSVLVRQSDLGSVEIRLSAIDTLVQKCVRGFASVRDCATTISAGAPDGELSILIRLMLLPDTQVPELSEKMQAEVKSFVETHSGVRVREVKITVESTGVNPTARVQ